MKPIRFLPLLLIALFLAGCGTVTQQDRAVLRAHNVPQDVFGKMLYGDPLSPDEIIVLSQHRVPPGLIIHYIDVTDTVYRLRKADVKHLRDAGVDEQVISCMLSTAPAPGPLAYRGNAYPYPYDPYFYDPYFWGGPGWGPAFYVRGGGWGRDGWHDHGWDHGDHGDGHHHH